MGSQTQWPSTEPEPESSLIQGSKLTHMTTSSNASDAPQNAPTSFDEALGELRDIVTKLQQPDVSIDWLTTAVQRASVLLAYCNSHLHATEGEVAELIKQLGIETEN